MAAHSNALEDALAKVREVVFTEANLAALADPHKLLAYQGLTTAQLDVMIKYWRKHEGRDPSTIGTIQPFVFAAEMVNDVVQVLKDYTGSSVRYSHPSIVIITPYTGYWKMKGFAWGTPWCGSTGNSELDKELVKRLGPPGSIENVLRRVGALDDV